MLTSVLPQWRVALLFLLLTAFPAVKMSTNMHSLLLLTQALITTALLSFCFLLSSPSTRQPLFRHTKHAWFAFSLASFLSICNSYFISNIAIGLTIIAILLLISYSFVLPYLNRSPLLTPFFFTLFPSLCVLMGHNALFQPFYMPLFITLFSGTLFLNLTVQWSSYYQMTETNPDLKPPLPLNFLNQLMMIGFSLTLFGFAFLTFQSPILFFPFFAFLMTSARFLYLIQYSKKIKLNISLVMNDSFFKWGALIFLGFYFAPFLYLCLTNTVSPDYDFSNY